MAAPDAVILHDDEAVADMGDEESTMSVRSSIFNFPQRHGRSYHAYKDGSYHRPNDETELERLDIMNVLFSLVNEGRLYLAPLQATAPVRILDIGTGTGSWAIEMGDTHEAAEVVGIDLSPTMPTSVPPNVFFEIADVEDNWTFTKPFDYVHSRYMSGSIKDWPRMMQQTHQNLNPGGWAEFVDFDLDYYAQDGTMTQDHAIRRWLTEASRIVPITGRTMKPGPELEKWMKDAGFVNVQVMKTPLPLGKWPKNQKLKEIGMVNWTQLMEGFEGLSYRALIDLLGWKKDDVDDLIAEAREDLRNPRIHALFDMYTVWGQKPE